MAGMRGTGSNTLVAKDAFVPDHRIISVPSAVQGHYGTEHTDEALYRSAYIPVASLVLAGPQLGLALAALDFVLEDDTPTCTLDRNPEIAGRSRCRPGSCVLRVGGRGRRPPGRGRGVSATATPPTRAPTDRR